MGTPDPCVSGVPIRRVKKLPLVAALLHVTTRNVLQVKDDPELLKRTIKRMEQQKKRSSKKWDSRIEGVQKKKQERQQKRQENISKRKKDKKTNKLKKASKKGRVIPGY